MERFGDLRRDDRSAPRQGEDDRLVLLVMSKLSGESPASVASIPVNHDRLPFQVDSAARHPAKAKPYAGS